MAKGGVVMQSASFFPGLTELLLGLLPEKAKRAREEHQLLTRAKLERRIALGKDRPDLIEGLLKKKDEWVSACVVGCWKRWCTDWSNV